MEAWYKKVRLLKDESEAPYQTERVCHKIFNDLRRAKVREKGKFKNRMGPEFETWAAGLGERFAPELVNAIISEDEFWEMTLKLTLGI